MEFKYIIITRVILDSLLIHMTDRIQIPTAKGLSEENESGTKGLLSEQTSTENSRVSSPMYIEKI